MAHQDNQRQQDSPKKRKGRIYVHVLIVRCHQSHIDFISPMKASNQNKRAEERGKNDVQVGRLFITSRKVEEIVDGDES
ncbi:hypothetical protein SARC_02555 [Sphaeroforma arctica JP610]|uniref:Uncharacterized protein n=1 Tax=Sphaeroforma arctica JP610 TaxID=667725 RepID=A0A0L0G8M1_9EUKA|nr:hypothetical protein SARC_02555 [Sphaeroforma arctica JP610]KNC85259.1 hypothetical protein SARC_02555 [Sphaeroforma arctica JP610]|eukprot:XP_014159161.1 hypothetical protein SARC_02555 [Sphaeroforma arctica JP610]